MKITERAEDKLRFTLNGACVLVGAVFWSAKVLALSFAVTWTSFIIAALFMADPETTTFRDFLLMIQNPTINNMVFVAACLVSGVVFMFGAAGKSKRGLYKPATATGAMGANKEKGANNG